MSLNKRYSQGCRPDHLCCQQSPKLSKQVQILQNKLRNTKQDLQLAQRVNARLVEQLSKQGRSPSPGLVLKTDRSGNETLRTQAQDDQLTKVKQEYERRVRHMQMQIDRINQDATKRIELVYQQRQMDGIAVQERQSQLRSYIRDLESQIRQLRENLQTMHRQNSYLVKDKDLQTHRASKLQSENKVLQADYLAMKLQMRHMKDALRDMQNNYSNMNSRLLTEQQLARQAMSDNKSKGEELERVRSTERKQVQGRDRYRSENQQLRKAIDTLDEYAFDQHRKRDQSERRMHSLHDFGLKRVQTVSDLKRSLERTRRS